MKSGDGMFVQASAGVRLKIGESTGLNLGVSYIPLLRREIVMGNTTLIIFATAEAHALNIQKKLYFIWICKNFILLLHRNVNANDWFYYLIEQSISTNFIIMANY